MGMEDVKSKIRAFLGNYIKAPQLEDSRNFFSDGLLNSLFAMQLVLFVEKTFGIRIENEDLGIENFSSINAITDLVNKKRVTAE